MSRSGLFIATLAVAALATAVTLLLQPSDNPQTARSAAQDPIPVQLDHGTLLQQYCIVCHSQALATGGLVLEGRDPNDLGANPDLWEKVLRKLRANAMPPTDMPRPEGDQLAAFATHLKDGLDQLALKHLNPGRTPSFNRLSRSQYQNAIRDLLALEVDVADLLPSDDVSFGFDNVNLTNLSPTLMERYLSAAQKISRMAVGSSLPGPVSHVELVPADLTQEDRFEGLPFGTRGGTQFAYHFPQDGEYRIDVTLARDRNENIEGLTEPHEMEMLIDGERVGQFEITPNRSQRFAQFYYSDQGAGDGLQTSSFVTAGSHQVAVTFVKKNSALIETTRQPYQAHFNRDRHPRQQPAVLSVAIAGPFDPSGVSSTASRDEIFSCRPNADLTAQACARSIVGDLAQKAYRRPLTDADLETPMQLFEQANANAGFEAGIEMALRAILVSPDFLFRIERDPTDFGSGQSYTLSDVELASRLAFFLWGSIPDQELLDLAVAGRLREPLVLEQQVHRMLADPRSGSLASDFLGQWLYLRNLDAAEPNSRLFPDFDGNLRRAMRTETELLFQHIVAEDRDVMELLNADYTFLNERLARHYEIPNVYGDQFRQVVLPADSPRSGLLGHGSVLTVTSYATRTSPVQRGKWVLDNILGIPPPPPPDNVPALSENPSEVKIETMRDRMAQHRANPACAQCHQVMDPIGLVFENFDAIGRWRVNNSDHPALDTSGNLPGGAPLEGVQELRQALLANEEAFVGTMSEKLLTYALGRGLEFYDAPAVRKIVRDTAAQDNRFSALVMAIVNSVPFQMRKTL